MPIGAWWRGDTLPQLSPLPAFSARRSNDTQLIAQLAHLSQQEVTSRIQRGHLLYLAYLDETPVAYGWIATRKGGIHDLQFSFTLPPGNFYLWDFQTLPAWRGRGIYPHLLQAIIHQETHMADRFWIGYAPGNDASARGISKAGFQFVCDFVITDNRITGLLLFNNSQQAQACSPLFNLPVVAP